jgi:hypothetical protein
MSVQVWQQVLIGFVYFLVILASVSCFQFHLFKFAMPNAKLSVLSPFVWQMKSKYLWQSKIKMPKENIFIKDGHPPNSNKSP